MTFAPHSSARPSGGVWTSKRGLRCQLPDHHGRRTAFVAVHTHGGLLGSRGRISGFTRMGSQRRQYRGRIQSRRDPARTGKVIASAEPDIKTNAARAGEGGRKESRAVSGRETARTISPSATASPKIRGGTRNLAADGGTFDSMTETMLLTTSRECGMAGIIGSLAIACRREKPNLGPGNQSDSGRVAANPAALPAGSFEAQSPDGGRNVRPAVILLSACRNVVECARGANFGSNTRNEIADR